MEPQTKRPRGPDDSNGAPGRSFPARRIPPGWEDCPKMGIITEYTKEHRMIPMKVPLSGSTFTPKDAADMAVAQILEVHPGLPNGESLALVIDLTNSDRYYKCEEFTDLGISYVKVRCKGRGESPNALAVNQVAWEIHKLKASNPHAYCLIHCTHGFNRTGFVMVSVMTRLLASKGVSPRRGLRDFAEQRPPGIYKDDYISDLFRAHNELRPRSVVTPPLPAWKPEDDPDEDGAPQEEAGRDQQQQEPVPMEHEDQVGEAIAEGEADYIRKYVYQAIMAHDDWMKASADHRPAVAARPFSGQVGGGGTKANKLFAGSQPVSLDKSNLQMVMDQRYYVTWKADGTRYMMLLTHQGCYLIDRACKVRRVQMRCPTLIMPRFLPRPAGKDAPPPWPVGQPHAWTLLDGEMVVDTLPDGVQRRRYLAYDIMFLNREGVMDLQFKDRYELIQQEVIKPRHKEAEHLQRHPGDGFRYDYGLEPFGLRRKDFWPLHQAGKVLRDMMPKLCHETDGLILQPWCMPYVKATCHELLKWKFAHLNSVDFKLEALPGQKEPRLQIYTGKGHDNVPNARFRWDPALLPDPQALHARVVECAFDPVDNSWVFLRVRGDKPNANHVSVYHKVVQSIRDGIKDEQLLDTFQTAYQTTNWYLEERAQAETRAPPPNPYHNYEAKFPPQLPPHNLPPPAHHAPYPQPHHAAPYHPHHPHPQQQQQQPYQQHMSHQAPYPRGGGGGGGPGWSHSQGHPHPAAGGQGGGAWSPPQDEAAIAGGGGDGWGEGATGDDAEDMQLEHAGEEGSPNAPADSGQNQHSPLLSADQADGEDVLSAGGSGGREAISGGAEGAAAEGGEAAGDSEEPDAYMVTDFPDALPAAP